ncbi:helix-turn-helix domain-containing protein [Actinoplanes sp. NPDC051494]|uniref:helix-turn-helix domain-containing protein n=1 Tax=Actinoplanes sp. NPDC051494 TaxID=3363907 RepID=UPI0037890BB7
MPTVMSSGPESTGRPEVARALLGGRLRALRETQGISRGAAGRYIGCSDPKISRIELGATTVKESDLSRLLDLYRVDRPAQRLALLRLAGLLNAPQWWHDDRDVLPGWLCSYLVLEEFAEHIRTYETRFVPGLLQTPAYAEAVIRLHHHDEREVRRRVDVRRRRQHRILRRTRESLWAVIDEAALTMQIASPAVMREQIDFLIRATTHKSVSVQVLPTGLAAAATGGMSFSMLRLPIEKLTDVIYLEQINSAIFLDDPYDCDPYMAGWQLLMGAARKPAETLPFLRRARDALR